MSPGPSRQVEALLREEKLPAPPAAAVPTLRDMQARPRAPPAPRGFEAGPPGAPATAATAAGDDVTSSLRRHVTTHAALGRLRLAGRRCS